MSISRRDFFKGNFINPSEALAIPAQQNPTLHLLNRVTWGPRPDDVAYINRVGVELYLEEQLNPERIDDALLETQLQQLPLLSMDRRQIYGLTEYEYRTYKSLVKGMLLRAIYSRRQLLERMVEFWTDHFNIHAEAEYVPDLMVLHQTFRQHAFGKFRDLLLASAKNPAMLIYLDNFVNVVEHPNENYARELLELHTMGVDGGYTEADIKAVARAFSGWTINEGTRSGFYFDMAAHDTAAKEILGHTLPAGRGLEDGLHVLSLLAHHPATARFICHKLCVRFVSDNPPAALIERLVAVWQDTQGEIKAVLSALFLSGEFQQAVGQKFRRPLDFLVGALRASGTVIYQDWVWEELLPQLGQIPYSWRPPDGYPDIAPAWISTNGLLSRWNIAMQLTHGVYSDLDLGQGLHNHLHERIGQPSTVGDLVDTVAEQVFGVSLAAPARDPFITYAAAGAGADTPVDAHLLARKLGSLYGLMLASPLYQWR